MSNISENTKYAVTIEIEFPSILKDGKFYSMDLKRVVETPTYKKIYMKDELSSSLKFNETFNGLCHSELWIIRNNPKYDYLYKEIKL